VPTTDADHSALLFLSGAEATTIDAMAARIIPGDADDPGAREAGCVIYVDRMLAGFGREQQSLYRAGLRALDDHCREQLGDRFSALDVAAQDRVLADVERSWEDGPGTLGHFFRVVREHVVQGFFCDPAYGGNRGGVGWRLVGFPGARWGYGAQHMARDADIAGLPLTTLADLQAGDRSVE
jgi:gluconate 2-dehydrogenase gamma chain